MHDAIRESASRERQIAADRSLASRVESRKRQGKHGLSTWELADAKFYDTVKGQRSR